MTGGRLGVSTSGLVGRTLQNNDGWLMAGVLLQELSLGYCRIKREWVKHWGSVAGTAVGKRQDQEGVSQCWASRAGTVSSSTAGQGGVGEVGSQGCWRFQRAYGCGRRHRRELDSTGQHARVGVVAGIRGVARLSAPGGDLRKAAVPKPHVLTMTHVTHVAHVGIFNSDWAGCLGTLTSTHNAHHNQGMDIEGEEDIHEVRSLCN
jgi:hypothetical protein